jgi:hypothetical protein
MAFDHVWARGLLDQSAGEGFEKANVDSARQDCLEFVTAEAADLSMVTHH